MWAIFKVFIEFVFNIASIVYDQSLIHWTTREVPSNKVLISVSTTAL